jgi:hypothetical protein
MRRDLYDVIGGIRVRLGEKCNHSFVNSLSGGWLNHFAKNGTACGKLVLQPQHETGNRAGFRAGQANHANAAAARRRGNCDNRIVEIHSGLGGEQTTALTAAETHNGVINYAAEYWNTNSLMRITPCRRLVLLTLNPLDEKKLITSSGRANS